MKVGKVEASIVFVLYLPRGEKELNPNNDAVVSEEISAVIPQWGIDFMIGLVLAIGKISKAPYPMVPKKMDEPKCQFEEKLDKGMSYQVFLHGVLRCCL